MTKKFKRHRSMIVKILDNYYFKEIPRSELQDHISKAISVVNELTTREDLENLMSQHQNETLPNDSLQWRLWLFPRYKHDSNAKEE